MAHPLLKTVHKQTRAGQLTPLQGQAAAHALGGDPSSIPVPCEAPGCTVVKPLKEMYSLVFWYGTFPAPPEHASAYQCENRQHYGCTHEHAVEATIACLRDGHMPSPESVIAARQGEAQAVVQSAVEVAAAQPKRRRAK